MREPLQPRRAVREMAAYSPPTAGRDGKLRLDFNENTEGCSPKVAEFLRTRIDAERIAIYPEYVEARKKLAQHFGVSESEMLLTNGTDEATPVSADVPADAPPVFHWTGTPPAAAPESPSGAWITASRGIFVIKPSSRASRKAFPNADVLPRLPPGSTIQSGGFQSR